MLMKVVMFCCVYIGAAVSWKYRAADVHRWSSASLDQGLGSVWTYLGCKTLSVERARWNAGLSAVIRPLSDTSSFSNDAMRFTSFFVYNGDRVSQLFWGELKFDRKDSSRFLYSFVILGNWKTYAYLYDYCVYNQLRNIQPSLPM